MHEYLPAGLGAKQLQLVAAVGYRQSDGVHTERPSIEFPVETDINGHKKEEGLAWYLNSKHEFDVLINITVPGF